MKSTIKRAVINLYCTGVLPSWFVSVAFRMLGLEEA